MKNLKNVLLFAGEAANDNVADEIIDDSALIDCINQLNSLREGGNDSVVPSRQKNEKRVLKGIDQISAEMKWFSQWLTVKSKSVA